MVQCGGGSYLEVVGRKEQKNLPRGRVVFWDTNKYHASSWCSLSKVSCNYGFSDIYANWENFCKHLGLMGISHLLILYIISFLI